jgi:hypothetical protein
LRAGIGEILGRKYRRKKSRERERETSEDGFFRYQRFQFFLEQSAASGPLRTRD